MRTITTEETVYTFNELSEESKVKALELWYRDGDEQSIQCDMFNEDANYLLSEIFKNVELSFSLSYCQGDGFSFVFDNFDNKDIVKFLNDIKDMKKDFLVEFSSDMRESIFELVADFDIRENVINGLELYIESERIRHEYSHSYTVAIECLSEYDGSLDFNDKTTNYIISLTDLFKSIYHLICSELETQGYRSIYYQMDIEDFNEYTIDNEYEFLENGRFYY